MADDRVVAVGLLTAADVALLGQGFRRLFPVPRGGDFADLLHALDEVELIEETGMNMAKAQDEPSEVAASNGRVLMDGPGGLAVTFTPKAARETGRRLGAASDEAERQPVVEPDDPETIV